jgi:hypothetical protein
VTTVTRYSTPLLQTEDQGDCPAVASSRVATRRLEWVCTRIAGHSGDHQAGGPRGQMYASWPAEEVAS